MGEQVGAGSKKRIAVSPGRDRGIESERELAGSRRGCLGWERA